MKTFDEALRSVISFVPLGAGDPALEAIKKAEAFQHDRASRCAAIAGEVLGHALLAQVLAGLAEAKLCENVQPCDCIAKYAGLCVVLGLEIGMEMEKQTTL